MDTRYEITASHTAPFRGRLRILNMEREGLLYEEKIVVNYDAILSPHVSDVARWQQLALRIVDSSGGSG